MKPVQFEEKEYEHALYAELQEDSRHWTPGQVLEHHLGFDYAARIRDPFLWELHRFAPSRGVRIERVITRLINAGQVDSTRLPSFDVNCFIQAKRPSVGSRPPKKLIENGIRRPWFRFEIEEDQQRCLSAVADQIEDRLLTIYAAPVFQTSAELFAHSARGTIVANSTFPSALSMNGHTSWCYSEPGASGVFNRQYERSEQEPFGIAIDRLLRQRRERDDRTLSQSQNLERLADSIRKTIRNNPRIAETPRAAALAQEWNRIRGDLRFAVRQGDVPQAVLYYLEVDAFTRLYNVNWHVIDDTREGVK